MVYFQVFLVRLYKKQKNLYCTYISILKSSTSNSKSSTSESFGKSFTIVHSKRPSNDPKRCFPQTRSLRGLTPGNLRSSSRIHPGLGFAMLLSKWMRTWSWTPQPGILWNSHLGTEHQGRVGPWLSIRQFTMPSRPRWSRRTSQETTLPKQLPAHNRPKTFRNSSWHTLL